MNDSFNKIFKPKDKVLCIFAHPDDAEVYAGGTIARLIEEGHQASLVVTTNGGKGSRETSISEEELAKVRLREQIAGAKELGIIKESCQPERSRRCVNLGYPDGEFENNYESIGKIVHHIREFKPDVIITHNPRDLIINFRSHETITEDSKAPVLRSSNLSLADSEGAWVNHRDHRKTAEATLDAVYPYCRDKGFFPEQIEAGLEPHVVQKILFADAYQSQNQVTFEIIKQNAIKGKALEQHASQISKEHVQEYLDECKVGEQYFELFEFVELTF